MCRDTPISTLNLSSVSLDVQEAIYRHIVHERVGDGDVVGKRICELNREV